MSDTIQAIESPRLVLRPLNEGDAAFIVALLNQPSFVQYIGDRGVRTLEDAQRYIADGPAHSYSQHGFGLMVAQSKDNATPMGMCGLVMRDYLPDPDIGFALLPEYRSQGFALEAAGAVLRHAFDQLGLKRVVAIVQRDNAASIRVLERLGMRAAGTVVPPQEDNELLLFACER